MTLADLLPGRVGRGDGTAVADMGAGRFRAPVQQDYQSHGEPLQNFGGGAPGESQWFRNLTPNMRRNFGNDWPGSPLQPPPTMLPDGRTPMHDPLQMPVLPWQPRGRQRGRA